MRDQLELHGFDSDGLPIFTTTRDLSGRRNRHLRRAGAEPTELTGSLDDIVDGPAAAPIVQLGPQGEIWGFAGGYTYRVEQAVDGVDQEIYIDALEGNEVVPFLNGIELKSWEVDTPVQEDVDDATPPAPADTPVQEDADEESTGDSDYDGVIADFEAAIAEISDDEILRLSTEDSRKGIRERALEEIESRTSAHADPED